MDTEPCTRGCAVRGQASLILVPSLKRESEALQRGEEERVPGQLTRRAARNPAPGPAAEMLLNWAGRGGL